ncbi:MAG: arginase family protein [Actinomycetota bacterium]|nr:arginase family protein [Actinomycetota bacterium]MDQ3721209.1 arginase family protein [Actinomycetota bacterium]
MDRPVSLVALRCRTSDRTPHAVAGVDALAPLVAKRLGCEPRSIGTPHEPRQQSWEQDLAASRGCLLEAGGQVDDALEGGALPVVLAPECSVALTTVPTAVRHRPDAKLLWLDAHGDFNTPDTTPSGYLGGMCLAGACGRWDPGLGVEPVDPGRVVLAGVRDLDDEERRMLGGSDATVIGASTVETLVAVSNALERSPVFVHLDLDVLEPELSGPLGRAQFPAPGGLAPERLLDVLEAVAGECELVGFEVASFEAPEDLDERGEAAALAVEVIEPLLHAISEEANVIG